MLLLIAGASLAGCNTLAKNNYFLPGGIDQQSAVAAQVKAAQQAPGPYPKFSQIHAIPKDVRPVTAWRANVTEALAKKQQADAAVAAYPYSLQNTEAFAADQRSRIPAAEAAPSTDASSATDAYAAKVRARATTPPPPN
jgi:S-adenosylmethionine:diacylglycerol 3-amino-3-carboxypropyl transferase